MRHTRMQKQEQGSLMVEVLAVLGLIALITPLLYQQINRRNEEISNANIATEVRTIKDGVTAYIQSYEQRLAAQDCNLMADGEYKNVTTIQQCTSAEGSYSEELQGTGFYPGIDEILDDYDINLFAYTLPAGYQRYDENEDARVHVYRPVIYGVITEKSVDENRPLRRSAKIASLIGLDGGVVMGNTVNGMDGTWIVENTMDAPERAIAAITAYDAATNSAILTDVKIEHFRGDTLQANVGVTDRLHAPTFFSVGDMTYNCVENYGNDTLSIRKSGDTVTGEDGSEVVCAPLFEVDAETGKIKMKEGNIETDLIAFSSSSSSDDNTKAALVPSGSISVSDLSEDGEYTVYQIDPAYTSVMNDIKLTSRGGARLSDILPTYINKGITPISGSGSVAYPSCPVGYAPAIAVIPTQIDLSKARLNTDNFHTPVSSSNLSVSTSTSVAGNTVPLNKTTATVSGTSVLTNVTTSSHGHSATSTSTVQSSNLDLERKSTATSDFSQAGHRVRIGTNTDATEQAATNTTANVSGSWTVTLEQETESGWQTSSDSKALVYTYCYYDSTAFNTPTRVRPD